MSSPWGGSLCFRRCRLRPPGLSCRPVCRRCQGRPSVQVLAWLFLPLLCLLRLASPTSVRRCLCCSSLGMWQAIFRVGFLAVGHCCPSGPPLACSSVFCGRGLGARVGGQQPTAAPRPPEVAGGRRREAPRLLQAGLQRKTAEGKARNLATRRPSRKPSYFPRAFLREDLGVAVGSTRLGSQVPGPPSGPAPVARGRGLRLAADAALLRTGRWFLSVGEGRIRFAALLAPGVSSGHSGMKLEAAAQSGSLQTRRCCEHALSTLAGDRNVRSTADFEALACCSQEMRRKRKTHNISLSCFRLCVCSPDARNSPPGKSKTPREIEKEKNVDKMTRQDKKKNARGCDGLATGSRARWVMRYGSDDVDQTTWTRRYGSYDTIVRRGSDDANMTTRITQ